MYEKLNLVSKTRGLESRIKIFLFNKSIQDSFNVTFRRILREKRTGGETYYGGENVCPSWGIYYLL